MNVINVFMLDSRLTVLSNALSNDSDGDNKFFGGQNSKSGKMRPTIFLRISLRVTNIRQMKKLTPSCEGAARCTTNNTTKI